MIERNELESLKSQLEQALVQAVASGDLTQAMTLRQELDKKMGLMKEGMLVNQVFTLSINYDLSIDDLIEEIYFKDTDGTCYVDAEDINEYSYKSTESGRQKITMYLLNFNKNGLITTSNMILGEMDKKGFRPATLKELLALCSQSYGLPEPMGVVALGSTSIHRHPNGVKVPCLAGLTRGFSIYSVSSELEWAAEYWRFAAVKK